MLELGEGKTCIDQIDDTIVYLYQSPKKKTKSKKKRSRRVEFVPEILRVLLTTPFPNTVLPAIDRSRINEAKRID